MNANNKEHSSQNSQKGVTLDALSASDLLLEQQEQQEKEQRERGQQGKSGLNRIKK